ncbi:hypothetical protein PG994_013963 [Apiospora phragmitis]|uniref:Uncharacterized protein n=1 Tax=Apiospora phragmitis TaxID=2905665 RepID=A0ABR1T4I5_9PEZI
MNNGKEVFSGDRKDLATWHQTLSNFSERGLKEIRGGALAHHRVMVERQMAVALHYWETAYIVKKDGSRAYPIYPDWADMIYPNSPAVVAFLPSLSDIEPVRLFTTGTGEVRR